MVYNTLSNLLKPTLFSLWWHTSWHSDTRKAAELVGYVSPASFCESACSFCKHTDPQLSILQPHSALWGERDDEDDDDDEKVLAGNERKKTAVCSTTHTTIGFSKAETPGCPTASGRSTQDILLLWRPAQHCTGDIWARGLDCKYEGIQHVAVHTL